MSVVATAYSTHIPDVDEREVFCVRCAATCVMICGTLQCRLAPAASAAAQRPSRKPLCAYVASLNAAGRVTLELYEALTAIQQERAVDDLGWVVPIA